MFSTRKKVEQAKESGEKKTAINYSIGSERFLDDNRRRPVELIGTKSTAFVLRNKCQQKPGVAVLKNQLEFLWISVAHSG